MKHRGPGLLDRCCRVESPHGAPCRGQCSCVAARESDGPGEPIRAPRCTPAASLVQGMRRAAWAADSSTKTRAGPWGNPLSLTSEIYTRLFGTRSLLQLANATVVLENGPGLSRAIRIICSRAES
jgi:hypothetical protein